MQTGLLAEIRSLITTKFGSLEEFMATANERLTALRDAVTANNDQLAKAKDEIVKAADEQIAVINQLREQIATGSVDSALLDQLEAGVTANKESAQSLDDLNVDPENPASGATAPVSEPGEGATGEVPVGSDTGTGADATATSPETTTENEPSVFE